MTMKHFIVSLDFDDYHRFIAERNHDAGICFQCITADEAAKGVVMNAKWGIPVVIEYTPEWLGQHQAAVHVAKQERRAAA